MFFAPKCFDLYFAAFCMFLTSDSGYPFERNKSDIFFKPLFCAAVSDPKRIALKDCE